MTTNATVTKKKPSRTRSKMASNKTHPAPPKKATKNHRVSSKGTPMDTCSAMRTSTASADSGSCNQTPAATASHRDLLRMKKELQVRVQELEMELLGETTCYPDPVPIDEAEDPAELSNASDESSCIIAMVNDLHAEIDTAYAIKAQLEADLEAMQNQLSVEKNAHAELQAQNKLLEAKTALNQQLQQDLIYEKQQHGETTQRLEDVARQLEQVAEQRDRLAEQRQGDAERIQEVQNELVGLNTKVSVLEATVVDMRRLREKLADMEQESQQLNIQIHDLKGVLETSEVEKKALELDLTTRRQVVNEQKEQLVDLKDCLEAAQSSMANLRSELGQQQTENDKLSKSYKRAERKTKTLASQLKAAKKELDSGRKALRDVRTATLQTKRRVEKQVGKACERKTKGPRA